MRVRGRPASVGKVFSTPAEMRVEFDFTTTSDERSSSNRTGGAISSESFWPEAVNAERSRTGRINFGNMTSPAAPVTSSTISPRSQVAAHTSELIAIDTTNTGGPGTVGEHAAATYIADQLTAAGGSPLMISAEAGRTNVVLRIPGIEPGSGTVVHGHLDVVPADADEWTVDPFSGLIRDGFVWGRGAVDMKGADAVMLSVALRWLTTGDRPRHDVVFAWVADEESGGDLGAGYLTRTRPELFAGCVTAIGEVGGFGIPLGRGTTLYPIMTGERSQARVRLTARGASGHGSVSSAGNPILTLARAITALGEHPFPITPTQSIRPFLQGISRLWKMNLDALDLDEALQRIGPLRALVEPALRASASPTMLRAGTAVNVAPQSAAAEFDCRVLPGQIDQFGTTLARIVGDGVEIDVQRRSPGFETSFDGPVVEGMTAAIRASDPGAIVLPYMVSASTDAPRFARLGMRTFGFTPLLLPAGFQFGRMFHGADERVPIAGLEFGVQVLERFLRDC